MHQAPASRTHGPAAPSRKIARSAEVSLAVPKIFLKNQNSDVEIAAHTGQTRSPVKHRPRRDRASGVADDDVPGFSPR